MNSHLFVYGTLLSNAGHPKGAQLQREARLVGAASLPGRLYRIGRYPGLVEGDDLQMRVHGEVYALHSPAHALKWLDAYEGIAERAGENEYQRVERLALLASGTQTTAWVYLYRKDVSRFQVVPGGRWVSAAP